MFKGAGDGGEEAKEGGGEREEGGGETETETGQRGEGEEGQGAEGEGQAGEGGQGPEGQRGERRKCGWGRVISKFLIEILKYLLKLSVYIKDHHQIKIPDQRTKIKHNKTCVKVIKQQQKQSIWGNDGNIKVKKKKKKRRRRILQTLSKQELDFGSFNFAMVQCEAHWRKLCT